MITFLTYQLKVAVIMAVFYIFFRLLLIKDSWHRLNRIVLLSTALLSLLLPVCIITIHKTEVLPVSMAQLMQAVSSTPAQPSTPWWHIALMTVYAAGVVFVLAKVLESALRVRSIIRHARKEITADGTTVYVMPGNAPSFSWMGHIVISEADWNNRETAVIDHEKAHVALHHSIDVLITDIIAALQWFNPAIWMLRIDLRAVHEYEADDTVLRSGTDIRSYQYLLISKAAAMNGYTIANNFNHSILKNRIFMMEKETSTRKSLLRALYLLPLVCISLALNAQTKVNYVYNDGKKSSGQLTYNDKPISASITYDEIKLDGESLDGITLDGISKFLPDVKTDAQGNITSQGHEVKKIIINGKVLYKKSEPADASPTVPKISYMDNGDDINIEFSGYTDEFVDGIIKSLPGVEYDQDGNMTVNGKKVSKILVNGKELDDVTTDELTEIQSAQ
ncbi:MAG: M56 family metallopeptidase [Bacteroidaceae bacterium]|nr:M56 family metallopeptidase [Bacteroidaceae bacterium]